MELNAERGLTTGGTSGIGLALAQALQTRGARVFITGRHQPALDAALHTLGAAAGACADVARPAGRQATLARARAQMIALNRTDPRAVDARFLALKPALEQAVQDHGAL